MTRLFPTSRPVLVIAKSAAGSGESQGANVMVASRFDGTTRARMSWSLSRDRKRFCISRSRPYRRLGPPSKKPARPTQIPTAHPLGVARSVPVENFAQGEMSSYASKMNATLDRSEEMQGSSAAMSGKRVVLKYEGTLWSGAGKFLSGQSLSATVSGRTPLVAVMETADLRNRHDSSEFGRLHCPRLRRVLRKREMRSGAVIVFRE